MKTFLLNRLYAALTVVFMVIGAVGLASCSDDEEVEEGGNVEVVSDIVGTWSMVESEGWGDTSYSPEYARFYSDGTYVNVQIGDDLDGGAYISRGDWRVSGSLLIMHETEGYLQGVTYRYTIVSQEEDKIVLNMMGVTAYLERVPDSVIEEYL